MEEKCIFCGSTNRKFLFSIKNYNLFQCKNCNVVSFSPLPSNFDINNYYNNYLEKYGNKFLIENKKILRYKKEQWQKRIKLLNKFLKPPATLLDIGCSTGLFLSTAKELGYDVRGIEISKKETEIARERFGLKVFTQPLEELGLGKESFDIITMWDILEHVKNPIRLIQESKRILKKNGILAISTINWNALNRKIFKRKWRFLIPIEHLYYYNPLMLKEFLGRNGFKVLSLKASFAPQAFFEGLLRTFKKFPTDKDIFIDVQSLLFLKIKNFVIKTTDPFFKYFNCGDIIEIYLQKIDSL